MKNTKKISYRKLAKMTGADRASVNRWLQGRENLTEAEALAIIQEKKKPKTTAADPITGLPWHVAKTRQQAIALLRENTLAERELDSNWLKTEEVFQVIGQLCGRLEQLPGKAKSELGLTNAQRDGIQKMLDQAREEAADQIGVDHKQDNQSKSESKII